jgi:hypothetical protein
MSIRFGRSPETCHEFRQKKSDKPGMTMRFRSVRHRAGAHPHLLRINLGQEAGHRGTGPSLVLIALNRADHSLPLDTSSMQILLGPAKLPTQQAPLCD